ncbi:MAG: hypothetical protein RR416_04180, partial [Clostridia bacterium]
GSLTFYSKPSPQVYLQFFILFERLIFSAICHFVLNITLSIDNSTYRTKAVAVIPLEVMHNCCIIFNTFA